MPQLNSFNTAPQASLGGVGSFAPGMRGLPASATLPLMNGHRLVAAAANETNPDFPLIPGLALERIEIVADGASSIYGSDAVAGVVNFITRKHFSGVEVNASYGVGDDYSSGFIGGLFGKDWGSGSILAAYQYAQSGNITGGDRDYRVQDFRPQGGIDTRATSCPSPNVLADTTFWSVYQAAPAFGLNTVNYCDNGAVADLLPASRTHSLFVSGPPGPQRPRHPVGRGPVLRPPRRDSRGAAGPDGLHHQHQPLLQGAPPGRPTSMSCSVRTTSSGPTISPTPTTGARATRPSGSTTSCRAT